MDMLRYGMLAVKNTNYVLIDIRQTLNHEKCLIK